MQAGIDDGPCETITIIVNLPPPKSIKQLRTTLGHTGYYRIYQCMPKITAPMKGQLKKDLSSNGNSRMPSKPRHSERKNGALPYPCIPDDWQTRIPMWHVDASSICFR